MKIIFIGTAEFGIPSLEKLIAKNYQILAVVTSVDKKIGRKQILTSSPIKQAADKWQVPVLQLEKIRNFKLEISNLQPDLIIVVAYGQILPKSILDLPKFGCINIHPSLLPKYRGPSPIQTAILNGDLETGTTLMLMDEQIDHGPIISQKKTAILEDETGQTLHNKLAELSADLLIETLPDILADKINPKAQNDKKATYTKILTRDDGELDFSKKAQELERQIRAFYPWPGTWIMLNDKRLKILKAEVANSSDHRAFATSENYLLPEIVQPEGKRKMSWEDFLRGTK